MGNDLAHVREQTLGCVSATTIQNVKHEIPCVTLITGSVKHGLHSYIFINNKFFMPKLYQIGYLKSDLTSEIWMIASSKEYCVLQ